MTNVTPLHEPARDQRRARGHYVKSLLDADGRSARYVAGRIGISNSAMSDRLKGKAPFLADELEEIAAVIHVRPLEFYAGYIAAGEEVGTEGLEPPTSSVDSRELGDLIPLFGKRAS